jgi:citrate lyase subunit beta/citryl-CoA lyase
MTRMRSLLFVPGDSEKKLAKSEGIPADVLILDLEDSVSSPNKDRARGLVCEYLSQRDPASSRQVLVRMNSIGHAEAGADLSVVMPARPDGIMLPKTRSPAEIKVGSTRILPVATETPQSLFTLGDYAQCNQRLAGLTWGAEDLSAAVGAISSRDENGDWTEPYRLVRSLCLFGAHAAGVAAIDTLHPDFRDSDGLEQSCAEARRDGFSGKLAIHPDQVEVINRAFTPSEAEMDKARRIVALFEANPDAGTLALDGSMLDLPHLVQARKTLSLAEGDDS